MKIRVVYEIVFLYNFSALFFLFFFFVVVLALECSATFHRIEKDKIHDNMVHFDNWPIKEIAPHILQYHPIYYLKNSKPISGFVMLCFKILNRCHRPAVESNVFTSLIISNGSTNVETYVIFASVNIHDQKRYK